MWGKLASASAQQAPLLLSTGKPGFVPDLNPMQGQKGFNEVPLFVDSVLNSYTIYSFHSSNTFQIKELKTSSLVKHPEYPVNKGEARINPKRLPYRILVERLTGNVHCYKPIPVTCYSLLTNNTVTSIFRWYQLPLCYDISTALEHSHHWLHNWAVPALSLLPDHNNPPQRMTGAI